MKTFSDSTGRAWNLELTIDAVKRVRSLCQVDLVDLQSGEPPLVLRLERDVVLLVDVIFALVKPQADAAGVTDEAFGRAMGGPAAGQAASAFWDELIDFFRHARPVVAQMLQAGRELTQARLAAMRQATQKALAEIATPGESSTSLPASLESTPAP